MPTPWKIFYSYSHRDEEARKRLGIFLTPLATEGKIEEWHDRKIEAGANWNQVISAELDSADLILLLVSPDFLASDYCFGTEVSRAFARRANNEVKVVPILLKECLWRRSRFSELQMIPRDAQPIYSSARPLADEAFAVVAKEISDLVDAPSQAPVPTVSERARASAGTDQRDLVRAQVQAYARLYERTRQRMEPGPKRTEKMEEIFTRMRAIATASHPMLDDLARSASPGDRLAAIAILQVFASEGAFDFLVECIASQKPFVGYHAARALQFAVDAVDATAHPALLDTLRRAGNALASASVGFDKDRAKVLREAEQRLRESMAALTPPAPHHD